MSMFEKAKTYIGVYGEHDIRTKLQDDHKIFKELTKEACEGSTPARRAAAFRKLKPILAAHARAEEAVVYAVMIRQRKSPDSRDHGNEGLVEHGLVDALLAQISATRPAGSDLWKARAKVLHEFLEHHINEEEKDVFEELGEHFDDRRREQMADDFEARKAALLEKKPSRGASTTRAAATHAPR
jgi:hemerythrin superfamily protein